MAIWSQRLISELETADFRAEQLVRPLTREQLNWPPAPGAWSIGQCLEHLLLVNEIYLPAISISLDGRQQSQVSEVTPGWFSRWFIRNYIAPFSEGGGTRSRAPRKIRPAKDVDSSVLDAFLRSNKTCPRSHLQGKCIRREPYSIQESVHPSVEIHGGNRFGDRLETPGPPLIPG